VDRDIYAGREQTLVKHVILREYLQRFARIVGTHWDVLTYVDCFAGPWNVRSDDLSDSSFAIALDELRKARETLRANGKNVALRCFFLEKDRDAYERLKAYAASVTDAEVVAHNSTLEDSVGTIVDFVQRGLRRSFPFIFIDPTGWTGFELDTIRPLLRLKPGEVLINFMTGHIRRFLDSDDATTQQSLRGLFGSDDFKMKIRGLDRQDRDDAAVQEYSRQVMNVGGFRHVCPAIVLNPEIDRTHFHLIYATRNALGVEVFKDAEKHAMAVQERARAEAQGRAREERTGQIALLNSEELHDSSHYNDLRNRYLRKSQELMLNILRQRGRVPYDDVWALAMSQPMTWESDLKAWIADCGGVMQVGGLQGRQRVPQRGRSHVLHWTGRQQNQRGN
jgi:three-Cys-motif partner protein